MINVMPSSSIRVLGIGEEYRVQDLLSAVDDCETLRGRVKELEADPLILAQESRIAELEKRLAIYEKDGCGVVPVDGGRCVEVYQDGEMVELETSEAGDEVIALRARVAELDAPPVVPEGWKVESTHGVWMLLATDVASVSPPPVAYRALAWAIENDQRPQHEGNKVKP